MTERSVILRDSTLREGLDTPGVAFSPAQRLRIVALLAEMGVPEAEIVAPSRVLEDLAFARAVKSNGIEIRTSGLIYANRAEWQPELERCGAGLDRVDFLMPLSARRPPVARHEKIARIVEVLQRTATLGLEIGVGFPHATQVEADFLLEISRAAVAAGAKRVTVYDTNGSAEPFGVRTLVGRLVAELAVGVLFHGHDDLGLATANAWAAVLAGAQALDVTINGLGDRAGNVSLEQVAMLLHLHGIATGVRLASVMQASHLLEELSGVAVSKLAPVVGAFVFDHKSPSHLPIPTEFEAFNPDLVGSLRHINEPPDPSAKEK